MCRSEVVVYYTLVRCLDIDSSEASVVHRTQSPRSRHFQLVGDQLYYTDDQQLLRAKLGAPAGEARDLGHVRYDEHLESLVVGDRIYFSGNDEGRGVVTASSSSTELVTLLEAYSPFEGQTIESNLTSTDHGVYFTAADREHGTELWRTDGTPATTEVVVDLVPGALGSSPGNLSATSDGLFFSASTPELGRELYFYDAATRSARLVRDLVPGPASSSPSAVTLTGSHGVFMAHDGVRGRQAYSVDLERTGCTSSQTHLCLRNSRFQIDTIWRDFDERFGSSRAVPLTPDTGYFWFLEPDNVENVVKVLDARGVNEHFWVFFGALSNLEYWLTVTDTSTGLAKRYFNPPGSFASLGDTEAFGPRGVPGPQALIEPSGWRRVAGEPTSGTAGACVASETKVCLNDGRFGVELEWKDFGGSIGDATTSPLTDDTGTAWFFDDSNIEVVFKILDATAVNGSFWFFYGALSNVEYTITVTDHVVGRAKIYRNPPGTFASAGDTSAFPD